MNLAEKDKNMIARIRLNQSGFFVFMDGGIYTNIGDSFRADVIDRRAMAQSIKKDFIVYETTSLVFGKIAARAHIKDSGCMFGIEYLLWLPSQNQFARYFVSHKNKPIPINCTFTFRSELIIVRTFEHYKLVVER
ncbi:unnamed protein product [marine sediment metagenome]|uniref:Uncharacterized protein n=1 Tax=marine sediment metagenome TaxID=412755 RepID=X0W545_9ZZZZ